jgi:hypothetical protein
MQMVMPYLAFLAIMAFKVHNCFILRNSIYLPPQEKLDFRDGIKGVTGKMQVHRTTMYVKQCDCLKNCLWTTTFWTTCTSVDS